MLGWSVTFLIIALIAPQCRTKSGLRSFPLNLGYILAYRALGRLARR